METAPEASVSLAFGRFQVLPHRRELLADGLPLKLGGRAYDVLMALIEARGAVVSKDALIARVWSGQVVEENALQAQISMLRAALGPARELIRTVTGRGYQFTGEIRAQSETSDARAGRAPAEPGSGTSPTNLPVLVSELIGRDDDLRETIGLVTAHRLVTLTGPGGIGKTRLALAVARELLAHFTDGVWLAELSPLVDPGLIPTTVATAAELELGAGTPSVAHVAHALTGNCLLVLDTCEHVIDGAAAMAEALVRANPAAHVMATSREPLMAEGERIFPVSPLAVPAEDAPDGDDVRQYGAVRLFLERARGTDSRFVPDRAAMAVIGAVCRRLDGLPLAVELAAARITTLGVHELAARLDDRFDLLAGGRRTALPRHQTLRATLDWSFDLLPSLERVILCRLAIFAGPFGLNEARAIVASAGLPASEVVAGVANLVEKSLVAAIMEDTGARYRMLDTTRAYAREKLSDSGELQDVARSHADFFLTSLQRAEPEQGELNPMPQRLAEYRRDIYDVRTALDWAFSPLGNANVGVALTIASERLWFGLSLMEEYSRRVETALLRLRADASGDTRLEMRLSAARGAALYYANGPGPDVCAAWTDVLTAAEKLGDAEYRLRAFWGLWSHHAGSGELRTALKLAQRLSSLPSEQVGPTGQLIGERLLGTTQYFLGDLSSARRHLDKILGLNPAATDQSHPNTNRFEWSRHSSARGSLIPVLWLQGFPDQAIFMAQNYVEEARRTGHPISLCWALYAACPIAIASGDLVTAERLVTMLLEHTARHAPGFLQACAHGFQGELLIKRGDVLDGIQCSRLALDELRASGFALRCPAILGALAEGLAAAGRATEGLLAIEEALTQCERSDEKWNLAELLRIKGELLLLEETSEATAAAENHMLQGLDCARRQGALSWELRCANSLARMQKEQQRIDQAHELLSTVYHRFTEGFETADLKTAKALHSALQERRHGASSDSSQAEGTTGPAAQR